MALTIEADAERTISLEEYLAFAASLDLRDEAQVLESAAQLKALANNREFLVAKFNRELADWRSFQPHNSYSSQTLALGGGNGFFVRANMWTPVNRPAGVWEWESKLFAYSQPHDHNFSFLTVGYCGSGYATTIYEYSPEAVVGLEGERVDLRFLERTTLPAGKVMYYRASRDIHSQDPPEEFSISINLLTASPEVSTRNQYWFDLEEGRIKNYVQNPGTARSMLCKLARYVGNGETVNALEALAKGHLLPRVRAVAMESMASLEAGSAEEIWKRALSDEHEYVRYTARTKLAGLKRQC